MFLLIGVFIVGIILLVTYVNLGRQEIQKRQAQIEKDLESLKENIKEEERKRHETFINKKYEGGV